MKKTLSRKNKNIPNRKSKKLHRKGKSRKHLSGGGANMYMPYKPEFGSAKSPEHDFMEVFELIVKLGKIPKINLTKNNLYNANQKINSIRNNNDLTIKKQKELLRELVKMYEKEKESQSNNRHSVYNKLNRTGHEGVGEKTQNLIFDSGQYTPYKYEPEYAGIDNAEISIDESSTNNAPPPPPSRSPMKQVEPYAVVPVKGANNINNFIQKFKQELDGPPSETMENAMTGVLERHQQLVKARKQPTPSNSIPSNSTPSNSTPSNSSQSGLARTRQPAFRGRKYQEKPLSNK